MYHQIQVGEGERRADDVERDLYRRRSPCLEGKLQRGSIVEVEDVVGDAMFLHFSGFGQVDHWQGKSFLQRVNIFEGSKDRN